MNERYDYMDWLRVFSIVAVVGVHVVSKIINSAATDEWAWQFANVIDSGLRWCVPIFFMLSGALLLTRHPDEPVGDFLKKRLSKLLIPLVVWSGFYMVYNVMELGESYTAWEMVKLFLTDDVYYHLWFMYTILGLYLMAPFLRILVHYMSQQAFQWFLGFWLLFSAILPFFPKYLEFELAVPAGLFSPYIGYFMLGAYLVMYPLAKKHLVWLGAAALLSYIATIWGTVALTNQAGELDEFYYEHYRPNAFFISLFLFVLFQKLSNRLNPNPIITRISMATLGIYVIHPLIQLYLNKFFGINETMIHPAFGIPVSWILIFLISLSIILVLQKIPVVKNIVP
ncbi:acyltransferase [Planococcus sp. NCCP-2050]|uniref:acyltransferase n=1 Tax=Planococcus sp. NCCP-2050 TaxID=2944679 RepID=UPI0020422319|nr:acyltransferase family protein [Planococcus sp. NCCP-2050]GKW45354.1 membrane protein [Planococcus sp. NCCP-2050]